MTRIPFSKYDNIQVYNTISSKIGENLIKLIDTYSLGLQYWNCIIRNPHISIDLVEKYYDKPWNLAEFSKNPNITIEFIDRHPEIKWNWWEISEKITLSMRLLDKYSKRPWNWRQICNNRTLTMEIFQKYLIHRDSLSANWLELSSKPFITMEFIEENMKLPWDWWGISMNPNLTIEFIQKYHYMSWDWERISCNLNISLNTIELFSDFPWNWSMISRRPDISIEFIEKHPSKAWDWRSISQNSGITVEIIERNPHKPWDYFRVLCNPNITLDDFERLRVMRELKEDIQNAGFDNDALYSFNKLGTNNIFIWFAISTNPNITLEFIKKYIHMPFHWYSVFNNMFYGEYKEIKKCMDVVDSVTSRHNILFPNTVLSNIVNYI
jgi:hypothetical protein